MPIGLRGWQVPRNVIDGANASSGRQRAAKEQERVAKHEALAENERLKRLLADKPEPFDPGTR